MVTQQEQNKLDRDAHSAATGPEAYAQVVADNAAEVKSEQ